MGKTGDDRREKCKAEEEEEVLEKIQKQGKGKGEDEICKKLPVDNSRREEENR